MGKNSIWIGVCVCVYSININIHYYYYYYYFVIFFIIVLWKSDYTYCFGCWWKVTSWKSDFRLILRWKIVFIFYKTWKKWQNNLFTLLSSLKTCCIKLLWLDCINHCWWHIITLPKFPSETFCRLLCSWRLTHTRQHNTRQHKPEYANKSNLVPFIFSFSSFLFFIFILFCHRWQTSDQTQTARRKSSCRFVALFARQQGVTHNLLVLPDGQTFSWHQQLISQKTGKKWVCVEGRGR